MIALVIKKWADGGRILGVKSTLSSVWRSLGRLVFMPLLSFARGKGSGRCLPLRSENAEFLECGRASGVMLITMARPDHSIQVGWLSRLLPMGFENNGILINSMGYAPEKVRRQSRSLRHLPLPKCSPLPNDAGFFRYIRGL